MGYSNSIMSLGDISIDQLLFFFLHAACDSPISSRVPSHCPMFYQINKLPEDGILSLETLCNKRNTMDLSKS